MIEWLRRSLGGAAGIKPARKTRRRRDFIVPPLAVRRDATLPIVDWDAMDANAPVTGKKDVLDRFWTAVAEDWLNALGAALGRQYTVRESDRFLLLSALEESRVRAVLDHAEKTRKRILRVLAGVAKESEVGKLCLLVFENADQYYQYVANYYPPEGEFSLSGGMFLQGGYGHFVFVKDDMGVMEPTIAHELTHCLVQHLPLPAWLNEGIAVNTQNRLSPPRGAPLFTPEEMHQKHLAFWNETTMQEFWSGKSWLRPDEGNMLSYDLATHFVSLAAADFNVFRRFANAASWDDAGDAAARKHLGYPVAHLAEAVLGKGSWQPKPEMWKDGVERGQFNSFPDLPVASRKCR